MDFGAIIGFIAIIVINSLFNKDKKSTKPGTNPNRTSTTRGPINRVDRNSDQKPVTQIPTFNESRKTTLTGSLENLFKELRTEFDKNFGQVDEEQTYARINQNNSTEENKNYYEEYSSTKISETIQDRSSEVDRNSVYAEEIGREEISVDFNKKSMIQGIIMSEILQKPKSLRR